MFVVFFDFEDVLFPSTSLQYLEKKHLADLDTLLYLFFMRYEHSGLFYIITYMDITEVSRCLDYLPHLRKLVSNNCVKLHSTVGNYKVNIVSGILSALPIHNIEVIICVGTDRDGIDMVKHVGWLQQHIRVYNSIHQLRFGVFETFNNYIYQIKWMVDNFHSLSSSSHHFVV